MRDPAGAGLQRLTEVLRTCAPAAIAVSGGVDSMTLATVAQHTLGGGVRMFHAVSPAVPPAATARVRQQAARARWQLVIVEADEFSDEQYLANPANRCFFCKQHLYGGIARHTRDQILSGTNLDDLNDWRPGLQAAAQSGVRHPFVEAEIDKAAVRDIARRLGLDEIAELPAAPCLSSRVETGIAIVPRNLRFIDEAEDLVRRRLNPHTVRCRIRRAGIVIELDRHASAQLTAGDRAVLGDELRRHARECGLDMPIDFALYRQGNAFLREGA